MNGEDNVPCLFSLGTVYSLLEGGRQPCNQQKVLFLYECQGMGKHGVIPTSGKARGHPGGVDATFWCDQEGELRGTCCDTMRHGFQKRDCCTTISFPSANDPLAVPLLCSLFALIIGTPVHNLACYPMWCIGGTQASHQG